MAHEDIFCGVDKRCYYHFACNQMSSSGIYNISFDSTCDSITSSTNMHVVDPTGETIQLDGSWTSCPSGDLVTPFKVPSTCSSERDTVCSSVKQENEVCTDCIYIRWSAFSLAECDTADVGNFSVSSSPLPFPSPSPSQRQVCVLDWCALDSVRGRVWTAHTATATRGCQWVALSPAAKRKLVLHTSRRGLKKRIHSRGCSNTYKTIPTEVETRRRRVSLRAELSMGAFNGVSMGLRCSSCFRKLPWTVTRASCLGRARARSLVAPLSTLSGCLSLLDDG